MKTTAHQRITLLGHDIVIVPTATEGVTCSTCPFDSGQGAYIGERCKTANEARSCTDQYYVAAEAYALMRLKGEV